VQAFTLLETYTSFYYDVVLTDRQGARVAFSLFYYTQPDRDIDQALERLRERARAGDILATTMPHWAYLVTGLKTVMPPFEPDPQRTAALLDTVPVTHLLVTANDLVWRSAPAMLREMPTRWTQIYAGPSGRVALYERTPRVTAREAADAARPDR